MFAQVEKHINLNLTFLKDSRLLLAISGGVDSVVLAYLCKQIGLDFALAHCNFNLRGLESDNDEAFVTKLAEKLDVEVFIQNFDTENFAKANKLSIQMAARELRYQWFDELCEQLEFDYILTAHHADDNLETFLINLSRGTGLEGLTGIPEVNDNIVRPLLPFSREDIEAFADSNSIEWSEDGSNASVKYLRNKIRHEVVPILKGINPRLIQNFNKTIVHLKESQEIIKDKLDEVSDEVISVNEDSIQLNISKIKALNNPKAYLYELLKEYGFTEWNDVIDLLDSQSGKQVFSEGWRLVKDRESLLLSQLVSTEKETMSIKEIYKPIQTSNGTLYFEEVKEVLKTEANSIFVDKDKLVFPLSIRSKLKGDAFIPFGMKGAKKLSKFYKDQKLSLLEKENINLLCSGKTIVWVIGIRADNRFKVTESTKSILKISMK